MLATSHSKTLFCCVCVCVCVCMFAWFEGSTLFITVVQS